MRPVATIAAGVAQPSAPLNVDRWLLWPVAAAIGVVTLFTFVFRLPGAVGFLLTLLSLLVYALAAVALLVATVVPALKKQFRTASSAMFAVFASALLSVPISWMADYLHLALTVEFGVGYLGHPPPRDLPLQTYDWSTGLVGGPSTFLIRDDTDDIALPLSMHKHQAVVEYSLSEECAGKVRHLLGHYYICTF